MKKHLRSWIFRSTNPEHNVPYDRILLPTVESILCIVSRERNELSERIFTIMRETWYIQ